EADSTVGIVMKHISNPPPNVSDIWPVLPEALNPVLARAMAKAPDDRYQSAHELTQEAAAALGTTVIASPIVSADGDAAGYGTGRGLRHSSSGLTVWRKLSIMAQWGGRRLRGKQPDSLAGLVGRLFPTRMQRTLLLGSLVLVLAAGLMTASWL